MTNASNTAVIVPTTDKVVAARGGSANQPCSGIRLRTKSLLIIAADTITMRIRSAIQVSTAVL